MAFPGSHKKWSAAILRGGMNISSCSVLVQIFDHLQMARTRSRIQWSPAILCRGMYGGSCSVLIQIFEHLQVAEFEAAYSGVRLSFVVV